MAPSGGACTLERVRCANALRMHTHPNPDPNSNPNLNPNPNPNPNPNQVANRSLLLGPSGEVPPYYQHMHSMYETVHTCIQHVKNVLGGRQVRRQAVSQ